MVIIAAQDGHKGRLAPAWEMGKARAAHPVGAAPACLINEAPDALGHPKLAKLELRACLSGFNLRRLGLASG
jgi:hypothetical protein